MATFQIPKFPQASYDFAEYVDARNWIGGEWVDTTTKQTLEVIDPWHKKTLSKVHMSGAEDVDHAVRVARAAFGAWREWPIRERAAVFYRLRHLLEEHLEELCWLVTHENGKTYAEAKASVLKSIECAEFGCSLPNMAAGGQLDVSRGVNCRQDYEPVGVCAGVTPFNFPIMVPMWMLPQAIVGGNTFVLKPSEQVPLSMLRVAELLKQAGLPDGVFNIVNGGKEVVEAFCDHEDIDALGFVGSTRVAKLVYGRAAQSGKRVLGLGGAKNHLLLVPDADKELTTTNVVASFTGCAGQRCMAASVLVAVGEVDHLIDALVEKAKGLVLGEDMGTIINEAAVERITGYIDGAEKDGATIRLDGRGAKHGDGCWVGPTIIDHVKKDAACAREEIFGPVLSIVRVKTVDEAIEFENSNAYGNAACIYTTNGEVARYVVERVEAGMVGVNIGVPVPREPFGFGGWNDSKFGHGNITGWDGFRFWTRPRKVTSKWAPQKDWNWMA